jgi:cytosine/adenosine deaminase-related metal-dependent hydrolase
VKFNSADVVFPIDTASIPNGLLVTEDDGTIIACLSPDHPDYNLQNAEIHKGWLVPGFVNAHCHLELSHLKNKIPQHTGLDGFVQDLMRLNNASDAEKQEAMQAADAEMQANGIVAVGDISNGSDSFALKGVSKIQYFTFIERFGFNPAAADIAFESGKTLLELLKQLPQNKQGNLAPHANYSVSIPLLRKIVHQLEIEKGIFTIHNQESASENEFFQFKTGKMVERFERMNIPLSHFEASGKSSLETMLPYFPSNIPLQLVHNTFSSELDIQKAIQQNSNTYFCLCPAANIYIENKLPNLEWIRRNSNQITIGTDSLASNSQLDIVEELIILQNANPEIPVNELLKWGTLNGANYLGFSKRFGSFSKGKKPGIFNLLDVNSFSYKINSGAKKAIV